MSAPSPASSLVKPGKRSSSSCWPRASNAWVWRGLGHASPRLDAVGQLVTVHHRHRCVSVGKHPGGQQPGHAGAENHRPLSEDVVHHAYLLTLVPCLPLHRGTGRWQVAEHGLLIEGRGLEELCLRRPADKCPSPPRSRRSAKRAPKGPSRSHPRPYCGRCGTARRGNQATARVHRLCMAQALRANDPCNETVTESCPSVTPSL